METKNRKVAVVTGSYRGIGVEIVKGLCKKFDGDVFVTARNSESGQKSVQELEKQGYTAKFHQLDIENDKSVQNFASFLKENYGGLDILVNNAAIFTKDDSSNTETCKKVIHINYTSTIKACNALFPLLRPNARVVNVSSRLGLLNKMKNSKIRERFFDANLTIEEVDKIVHDYLEACEKNTWKADGYPNNSYNMSKIALNAVTAIYQKKFDRDESRKGIVISAVCPGYCKTEMTGGGGILTAEQGARTPIYLALLPVNFNGARGEFWAEDRVVDWKTGSFIGEFFPMLTKAIKGKFGF